MPVSYTHLGDALVELGQIEKGISKYIEAAEYADNSFNTPLYLMKAGELYESSGKYPDALKVYAVSYTHLDVYKRQSSTCANAPALKNISRLKRCLNTNI